MLASMATSYKCPMCQFDSPTLALNLSHLRLLHGSDPRFSVQCGVGGCSYTGTSSSALYSHIYRRHPKCGIIQKRAGLTPDMPQESETASSTNETSAVAYPNFEELLGIDKLLTLTLNHNTKIT